MTTDEDILINTDFIRPDKNDEEFKFYPYRARIVIDKIQSGIIARKPFADYHLRFYNKYDKESFEIASKWNLRFTPIEIARENAHDKKVRKEKDDKPIK